MKKFVSVFGFLIVLILITFQFQGRGWATITVTGGIIGTSTTWTAANSPYLITGDVFVKGTDTPTLTIEPNVTIMFAAKTSLYIGGTSINDKGKLIADGSLGKITFTADGTTTAGYWGGIYFDNYSDDGSYLKNIVVEYGGYNCDADIYCVSASPSIQDSIIGSSSQHGIRCNNSSPMISNKIIKDNSSHGIHLEGSSIPTMITNTITNNNYGIYCAGNSSSPTITTNKITNNKSYPVCIGANSVRKVFNNTYSDNNPNAIYVLSETIDTSGKIQGHIPDFSGEYGMCPNPVRNDLA
ncbi:right-handed parallel beta-helix repeat-containing protein [bacterium]|nr:right-handed parallel beta-helix repeat-containing protein [bacterium]MBU1754284.1 right-handed parallel beta-helix repeat-containing protein [bacterium]